MVEAVHASGRQWDAVGQAEAAACYHGGASFGAIGERFDQLDRAREVINADVLDAWFDPAPDVIESLQVRLPWISRTSPPTHCRGFIETVARVRNIPVGCVLPGAGSSDLIFLALREWLSPRSRVLILDPMYGEYAHVLERIVHCRVDRLMLHHESGFAIDPALLQQQLQRGYDLAVLVNPNSPTGQNLPRADLEAVLGAAPASTRIWIDETYVDFLGGEASLEGWAASSENVVVCKSLSKAYALSGLRAAYLVGPPAIVDALQRLTPPWAMSFPAQLAAVRALENEPYYMTRWRETHVLRAELAAGLEEAIPGLDVLPGVAGFLLIFLPAAGPSAREVISACAARNLFLRDPSAMGLGLSPGAVRIAVKDRATNERMTAILGDVWERLNADRCETVRRRRPSSQPEIHSQ